MDIILQSGDFLYTKSKDHITIVGHVGGRASAAVPEMIEGMKVSEIGCREKGGIDYRDTVRKLVLSKNVQKIDTKALIPGTSWHWIYGVEVASDNPFLEVSDGVLYTKGKKTALFHIAPIKEYVMPAETEEIADDAFAYSSIINNGLSHLSISDNCKKIGARAFKNANLQTIDIPSSVREIGDEAFQCSGATLVIHGDTNLGENVAPNIKIADGNQAFTIYANMLMTADKKRVLKYLGDGIDTEIIFPETTERIDSNAFRGAENIEKIKLNKGLKSIGSYAFWLTRIKTARLPASIEFFAPNAFENIGRHVKISLAKGCTHYRSDGVAIYHLNEDGTEDVVRVVKKSIQEFIVPETVRTLSENAFDWCNNLSSLVLPEGLREFDEECIAQSYSDSKTKLKCINLPASLEHLKIMGRQYGNTAIIKYDVSEENEHYFIDDDVLYEVNGKDDYTAMIGQNPNCRRLELVEGTTAVADYAFSTAYASKYTSLEEIILPKSLISIGEHAFAETAIKELEIPQGVRVIRSAAFLDCEKLEKINIPESVDGIAYNAFCGCVNLKEITVDDSNKHYCFANGALYNKDRKKLIFSLEKERKILEQYREKYGKNAKIDRGV